MNEAQRREHVHAIIDADMQGDIIQKKDFDLVWHEVTPDYNKVAAYPEMYRVAPEEKSIEVFIYKSNRTGTYFTQGFPTNYPAQTTLIDKQTLRFKDES